MSDATATPASPFGKNNPYLAQITENFRLNKSDSEKDTRHFVIHLGDSGLTYQPGYSIGIFPKNPPALVGEVLHRLHLDPAEPIVQKNGGSKTLAQTLAEDFTLNRVGKKFVKAVLEKIPPGSQRDALTALCASDEELSLYIFSRDVVDVLNEYPDLRFNPTELLETLGRSVPRLYSIASSQAKHPAEVHLTVATVRYTTHGREKKGLCSGYLADHVELNRNLLPVFIAPNKHFKLPENPATPIIMVGPGTGIAPFRAFLQQREVEGAPGRNWLFFGEQHRHCDFLYETEFNAWRQSGLLTHLNTAFSRDQDHKIYVQDRIREHGAEVWRWLQEGACFYVCGDAKRMARDVHQALIEVATQHGRLSPENAAAYVNQTLLKDERRYLRDVY